MIQQLWQNKSHQGSLYKQPSLPSASKLSIGCLKNSLFDMLFIIYLFYTNHYIQYGYNMHSTFLCFYWPAATNTQEHWKIAQKLAKRGVPCFQILGYNGWYSILQHAKSNFLMNFRNKRPQQYHTRSQHSLAAMNNCSIGYKCRPIGCKNRASHNCF